MLLRWKRDIIKKFLHVVHISTCVSWKQRRPTGMLMELVFLDSNWDLSPIKWRVFGEINPGQDKKYE